MLEDLTLVTPTPLNGSRPATPQAFPIVPSVDEVEYKEIGKLKKVWIASGRPGSGIVRDIRTRLPFYASDWTDAYNYRVIPATAMVFFAK